jgi:hypothetical protein
MARFRLAATHILGGVTLKAGTVIVDTKANQQPGDFLWPGGLIPAKLSPEMVPIDDAAVTMKMRSIRFRNSEPRACISGAESIG